MVGLEITPCNVVSASFFFFFGGIPKLQVFIRCNCLWAEKGVMTIGASSKLLTRLQVELNISASEQTSSPPLRSKRGCDIFRQHSHCTFITRGVHTDVATHLHKFYTYTHDSSEKHTEMRLESFPSGIDRASASCRGTFVASYFR